MRYIEVIVMWAIRNCLMKKSDFYCFVPYFYVYVLCSFSTEALVFPLLSSKEPERTHLPTCFVYYLSQACISTTKLAELRATDKQGKQNTSGDITHLNLLRICLSKHNYTTVAANY